MQIYFPSFVFADFLNAASFFYPQKPATEMPFVTASIRIKNNHFILTK
jgi:hypothetical protein